MELRRPDSCSTITARLGTGKDAFEHAESGEERFRVKWSAKDGIVEDEILACSQLHRIEARLTHPLVRKLQARFARVSILAIQRSSLDR
jgi:uncharacterized protein (UPF0548 family)